MKEETKTALKIGAAAGFLNGVFGSGGGMAAVPLLKKSGYSQKEAQATSLFLMLLLSGVTLWLCLGKTEFSPEKTAEFIPGGMLGALGAALLLKKINPEILRKIFGSVAIFSGLRIFFGVISEL